LPERSGHLIAVQAEHPVLEKAVVDHVGQQVAAHAHEVHVPEALAHVLHFARLVHAPQRIIQAIAVALVGRLLAVLAQYQAAELIIPEALAVEAALIPDEAR
jgi:hypothetical protein